MIYDAEGVFEPRCTAPPLSTPDVLDVLLDGLPKMPPVAPVAEMRLRALFSLVQVILIPLLDTDGKAKQDCDREHWPRLVSQFVPWHFAMDLPMQATWPS